MPRLIPSAQYSNEMSEEHRLRDTGGKDDAWRVIEAGDDRKFLEALFRLVTGEKLPIKRS